MKSGVKMFRTKSFKIKKKKVNPEYVISMNSNDEYILGNVKIFSKYYNIGFYKFGDNFSLANVSRVTFMGHGSTNTMGEKEISAENFADTLISQHHLPKNKKIIIDLDS
jgi:hypothetical protein